MSQVVVQSSIPGIPCRRGKVRDVYDLGETLLLVSTDRISAFDWILPTPIPDKGRILTQLSNFWFERTTQDHHLLETDVARMNLPEGADLERLADRSVLVKKTSVIPFECVVRGYLAGSGWREYQEGRQVCGVDLPEGLQESDRLPEPIFTPATKAEQGEHDENVAFAAMENALGSERATQLRDLSVELYQQGAAHALQAGLILADTKFEFGEIDGRVLLIDEVMTPDSSRYWPLDDYAPGRGQASFDKQFVRDWLTESQWDKNSPPP
ncbi:MAG: phosphoribosylaminoimidazolesuccinocarboxamide synthase, partial [Planctomycetales bacterium]|nr:phosphoribosylaminoimidazolesuccinocarboxamide synthase [Planctomycetales bacterium]